MSERQSFLEMDRLRARRERGGRPRLNTALARGGGPCNRPPRNKRSCFRSCSNLMLDSGTRRLVDEATGGEAGKVEGAADLVMRAGHEQMREQRPAGGNGLEAAGSPAAIEKDSLRRRG